MQGWGSHRLKRTGHCTLFVEAMSSRAGTSVCQWTRHFYLEGLIEDYRATALVRDNRVSMQQYSGFLELHMVKDCNSLFETVTKSGLPQDPRAAI